MFNKVLILEQKFPRKYGKCLRNLLSIREDIDYSDYMLVEESDAQEAYQNSSDFINKIKEFLPSLISSLS